MKLEFREAVKHSRENESIWGRDGDNVFMKTDSFNRIVYYYYKECKRKTEIQNTSVSDLDSMWTLVEEKKTLSDMGTRDGCGSIQYLHLDVKETLKKILKRYDEEVLGFIKTGDNDLYKIFKEEAGEDLI